MANTTYLKDSKFDRICKRAATRGVDAADFADKFMSKFKSAQIKAIYNLVNTPCGESEFIMTDDVVRNESDEAFMLRVEMIHRIQHWERKLCLQQ